MLCFADLRATGLVSRTNSVIALLSDTGSSVDTFVSFCGPCLDARSASSNRTSTRLKSLEPAWEGERVLLRSHVPCVPPTLFLTAGAHLVARVHQHAMIGSDAVLGEALISLVPMLGVEVAVHFSVELVKDGCKCGNLQGAVLLVAD
jgi:hypothetical protein